jgi:hypothetical protein
LILITGPYPTLFGEIGIPFDLDGKKAYKTGDYHAQLEAMDANMTALEKELLNFTLWNYCSDNDHVWGDQWNGEDLSLWSPSGVGSPLSPTMSPIPESPTELLSEADTQRQELDRGGRALMAFVRPYVILTPGIPKSQFFDMKQTIFTMQFEQETPLEYGASNVCEIFVPNLHFGDGIDVFVSAGTWEWEKETQRLYWTCGKEVTTPSSTSTDQTLSQQSVSSTSRLKKVGTELLLHKIVLRKKETQYTNPIEAEGEEETGSICPRCSIM